jgi:hypothetical protein
MPLIEVVKTPKTSEAALSTAMVIAAKLRKNAIITAGHAPGFVVNRRARPSCSARRCTPVEQGTRSRRSSRRVQPFGFPMDPFVLLELVGLQGRRARARHAPRGLPRPLLRESHALHDSRTTAHPEKDAQGQRSPIRQEGPRRSSPPTRPRTRRPHRAELQNRIEDGLADEIHRMLDETGSSAAEDFDLGMILAGGWPFQRGGATPYLDRSGERARVRRHLPSPGHQGRCPRPASGRVLEDRDIARSPALPQKRGLGHGHPHRPPHHRPHRERARARAALRRPVASSARAPRRAGHLHRRSMRPPPAPMVRAIA